MTGDRPRVVVAAADARHADRTDRLVDLVERLGEAGLAAEVLLIRGGRHRRRLRRVAPVTVADDLVAPPLGRALAPLAGSRPALALRARTARRHVGRRAERPWVLCDPEAAWFLRVGPRPPARLVVHFGDPRQHLAGVDDLDRAILLGADLWATTTRDQALEVESAGVTAPIHVVGDLRRPHERSSLPEPTGGRDPIVLSTPSGAWDAVAHTVEVARQLRRHAPDVPLVWLTDPGDDEWLARHDLRHLGLAGAADSTFGTDGTDAVEVRRRDDLASLRPALVVRTGYAASDPELVRDAALAGIATIGFEVGDLPPLAGLAVAPFAVEDLVARALALVEAGGRSPLGAELAAAIRRSPDGDEDVRQRLRPVVEALDPAPRGRAADPTDPGPR